MVKFLISRPIALSMTFAAIVILGIISMFQIPVSLLPAIDIPKITVQVDKPNSPAQELENGIIKPLRIQLMQLAGLKNIRSETRDGSSLIYLDFEHGTHIDYAFIETNEKIDRAMSQFPSGTNRPKVIKASATDIPVFYLNISLKAPEKEKQTNSLFPVSEQFMQLSRFAGQVIKKRIEQLPEIAMVDISGKVFPELLIIPDIKTMENLGISLSELEATIKKNNVDFGNLLIRDGQYQYNVRFANSLKNKNDIENIYFNKNGHLIRLKDFAQVILHPKKRKGMIVSDNQNTLSLAIIKQSDAKIQDVEKSLRRLLSLLENDYPDIKFKVTRDQTQLLDYTLNNLQQSLILGAVLAFLIMFFFLKDYKSPLLIGISIPVSLIITLLLFFLSGISINIISLSGLILGIGMMIDNSIIVIDNINQHYQRTRKLDISCVNGTNEVFRPMLSSVLTTCAVFIPLVFTGGISGALFYEQAMAVSIGLFISLFVSITLLPAYYRLFYKNEKSNTKITEFLKKINKINYEKFYEKAFHLIMKRQKLALSVFVFLILAAIILFIDLDKRQLPEITKDETIIKIDWNRRIHIDENKKRSLNMLEAIKGDYKQYTAMIGSQQYLLDYSGNASSSETQIYIKAVSPKQLKKIISRLNTVLNQKYPEASFRFHDADNIFNVLFPDEEAPLVARLRAVKEFGKDKNKILINNLDLLRKNLSSMHITIPAPVFKEFIVLKTKPEQLLLYDVALNQITKSLKNAFNQQNIFLISGNNEFIPVIIGSKPQLINDIIAKTTVPNGKGKLIPLRNLISQGRDFSLKTITAGQEGEYYPVPLQIPENQLEKTQNIIRNTLKQNNQYEAGFSGSIFSNRKLIKQLSMILIISLSLLYFILAAQFESLTLPFIVLLEVPIDIFGALLLLKIFGASINLMSLIGIVVMSGIIINDSILKIDTANQLMNKGYSVMHALLEAGHRRLKPILMTSLTTILALVPFLFTSGLGADLQKPLALSIIGGMIIGTLVSLFFIPLFYYYLKK
ncbi:MAG: efflux RND transporter permease subunit [Bacteroidales bacterium]|nr:efflux RND transporter permease subunit [Bacteroidales bacterium]